MCVKYTLRINLLILDRSQDLHSFILHVAEHIITGHACTSWTRNNAHYVDYIHIHFIKIYFACSLHIGSTWKLSPNQVHVQRRHVTLIIIYNPTNLTNPYLQSLLINTEFNISLPYTHLYTPSLDNRLSKHAYIKLSNLEIYEINLWSSFFHFECIECVKNAGTLLLL